MALWRYVAAGRRTGAPVLVIPELGFDRRFYEEGLLRPLQARGREVFLVEWRGTGNSQMPPRGGGGLEALFLGDAPAALSAVLEAAGAPRAQLIGHGLGGAAAVFLAAARPAQVSALVLLSVPAAYEVPNEIVRRLIAAARAQHGRPGGALSLAAWAAVPSPLPGPVVIDLFSALLEHGTRLPVAREQSLRAALGMVAPELAQDVVRWMESGELQLQAGPLLPAQRLSEAYAALRLPVLAAVAPRDNLVHPEHTLPLRLRAPHALIDETVISRIEGFPEDAGHLAPQAAWAAQSLAPRLQEWLEAR